MAIVEERVEVLEIRLVLGARQVVRLLLQALGDLGLGVLHEGVTDVPDDDAHAGNAAVVHRVRPSKR